MIVDMSMRFTNCDAATLYLYENDALTFKIRKTHSQNINKGEKGEKIDLPPVPLKEENDIDSLFRSGGTTMLKNDIGGLDDFELISFMVVV